VSGPAEGVGCFVAVAGPSGAGKDTLLRGAQERLAADARFVFARRVVTRQSDGAEDHDSVAAEEFERLKARGAFLLAWSANGLSYGLPDDLGLALRGGRIVVANVSRAVLPEVRGRFDRSLVVHVTASADVLAARLGARGREDPVQQRARLERALEQDRSVEADVRIDNSGALGPALAAFEEALMRAATAAPART